MPFVQRDRGRELEYDSRRPERIETEINDDPVIYCYETGENGGGGEKRISKYGKPNPRDDFPLQTTKSAAAYNMSIWCYKSRVRFGRFCSTITKYFIPKIVYICPTVMTVNVYIYNIIYVDTYCPLRARQTYGVDQIRRILMTCYVQEGHPLNRKLNTHTICCCCCYY